ncbi:MAG: beta strand repeat-containing protein, partial [Pirellulales bacterium]
GTLTLLAAGNILFANDVRSAGAGGINIVAGWNGSTGIVSPFALSTTQASTLDPAGGFSMAAVLATMNDGISGNDAAGVGGGSVFINGYDINGVVDNTVAEGIEVGSRFGATQVAAHDLLIRGSNGGQRWAQLGFRDAGTEFGLNGTIALSTQNGERNEWWGSNASADGITTAATQTGNIQGKDYISLLGGTVAAGGAFKGAGYGATGDITVVVGGRLDLRGGDANHAYAQIGHGGTGAEGVELARNAGGAPAGSLTTRDGAVVDPGDNNRTYFSTTWRTNYDATAKVDAAISITAGEDILIMAPSTFESNAGYTDLTNNQGSSSRYVKVGHGGLDNFGSYHGDISVVALGATTAGDGKGEAGAGIQVRAGMGTLNPAQIGHGGFHEGNRRTIWDQTSSGDITLRAETGAVRVLSFNLLPRTGDQNTGAYVGVDTILPVNSANDTEYEFSNVQIGHGGWHRDRVSTGGSFTAPGGAAVTNILPDQSMTGDILVYAGGTVQVRDTMGYDSGGSWTADPGPGTDPILTSGGILREVGIEVRAGNSSWAYGLIGHGGVNLNSNGSGGANTNGTGSLQGDISLEAAKGSIMAIGGEEKRSVRDYAYNGGFVQVGHGGYDADAMNATNGFAGAITVKAGQGGMNGLGQTVSATDGDIIFRTGRMGEEWALIGHGGRSSSGDLILNGVSDGVAPITVTARDAIEFTGRISGPTNPALLSTDYLNARITSEELNRYVNQAAGNVIDADTTPQAVANGKGYNIDIKFAQIGHGGYDFITNAQPSKNFSLNNDITVTAQVGAVRFTASDADNDYIQIGMGGIDFGGGANNNQRNITGSDLTVTAGGDIWFDARNAGSLETNRVPVGGSLGLETRGVSHGVRAFAMIGNGGYDIDGDFSGDVKVVSGGNLFMFGPTATVNTVNGYVGNTVEGVTAATGATITPLVGNAHLYTALQEATMKARSFTLYHGNAGASNATYKGNIVPGTFGIDLYDDGDSSSTLDVVDNDAADGTAGDGHGLIVVNNDALAGPNGTYQVGAVVGEIDYTTGVVTMFEKVESRDDVVNRSLTYKYDYAGGPVGGQLISGERTSESDSATRASQAYLGSGGIVPGSVSLVIDGDNSGGGRRVITDSFANGVLYNEQQVRVGQIDYNSGRIIIEGVNTATGDGGTDGEWELGTAPQLKAPLNDRTNPDEVVANYQYTKGNPDIAFVQIGNGGYGANFGGRNTPGHSGEIIIQAADDIRLHGGSFDNNSVQIGHGGRGSQGWHGYQADQLDLARPDYSAIDVDGKGNITITAGGIFEVLAGRGVSFSDNEQYAQVGHGGYDADGNHQGNIRVSAGSGEISTTTGVIGGSGQMGGVVFTAGQTRDASVQLGHGGFGARSSRADGDSGVRGLIGNITVTTTGDVLFTSGTTNSNFRDLDDGRIISQLGHGGYDADVRHDGGTQLRGTGIGHAGDITVTSGGSVIFQAGDGTKMAPGGAILGEDYGILHYTQLGHGGYSATGDHHGNITVTAADNIQFFAGSRTSDDSTDKRNYAILGMGGDEAEGYTGARDANNNPLDTITVTATNGDIEFVGGEGRRNWAQLGNGGFSNDGDHEANIVVSAGGDIHFIGGQGPADLITDTSRSLDVATWLAGTDRGGWTTLRYRDVRVNVVDFTVTVNGFNFIANGSTVQEADSDGAFTAANIIAKTNVDLDGDTVTDITAGTIVGEINLRTGQVRFFQDLDPTGLGGVTAAYNTGGGSSGAVNVPTTVENQSTNPLLAQAVRGFGGFAADSPHLQATFNNTRGGITDVAEAGGSPFDANIGIQSGTFKLEVPDGTVVEDDGSGHLLVTAAAVGSGLAVGQDVGTISYVRGQIALTAAVNPSGRIGTKATYQTSQKIGADYSYAQLGNGGWNAEHNGTNTDKSNVGNITVTAGGDVRFHAGNGVESYTQLGNGGYDAKGAHSGDIVVNAGGAVEFLAGVGADETDVRSYAQLGHGGYESDGNHFGHISVTSGTGTASSTPGYSHLGDLAGSSIGVLFKAGDREDNYVHMGLGGRSARTGTATTPYGLNGDITVISEGSVSFVGGTGSLNLDGDITGNSDFRLYAQLGHGGYDADAANSSRTIEFFGLRGGTGIAGTEGAGDGNWGHFGDIKVYAGGSVNFIGGDTSQTDPVLKSFGEGYGQYTYTQLGHGGYHASGDHSGNIDVRGGVNASGTVNNASADVYFAAGGPGTSEWNDIRSYAQLGHGGYNASAGELGRTGEIITVVAGRDVIAQGGLGTGNYVLIGHGGSFSDRNAANLDSPVGVDVVRGEIQLSAGRDVKVLAGDYPDDPALGQGIKSSYTWTGAEATRSLDWAANLGSGADFTLQFSRIVPDSIRLEIRLDDGLLVGELVQVGNDIKVNGAFSVDVNGDGNAENFADGEVVGSYNPSSRVVTFTRDVNPGDDAGAPNIRLFFEHADVNRAFAQIGHGGNDSDYLNGDATSPFADDKIVVNAVGSVVLAGGAGSGNYSMIGHGGQNTAGVKNGEILITSGGDTMLSGGTGNDSFVMIGHGGRDSSGSNSGDIKVTSGGKVKVNGGQGVQSAGRDEQFAMIGHGGQGSRGDHFGSITVNAVGDIDFAAGTTVRSSAYLGHGGWDADNPNDENPSGIGNTGGIFAKTTTGDIRFSAGQVVGVSESWTQLGHGGRSNEGNHSGAITVEATVGKINFEAGTGNNNYA